MDGADAAAPTSPGVQVDWQAVCLDLTVFFNTPGKTSYGQGELQKRLAESIGQHVVAEGVPERAVRLYLTDLFANATDDAGGRSSAIRDPRAVPSIDRPGRAGDEGEPHGHRRSNTHAA